MNSDTAILTLAQPCDVAVRWAIKQFNEAGLFVIRTFDLQLARCATRACPCPYHGTDLCACQMVVLLVYAGVGEPVTIVAHGDTNQTEFSVVDTPQQPANAGVRAAIRHCLPRVELVLEGN